MMKGMGNMGQMMKQAQKMQEDMQKAQEKIQQQEVVGESGGGLVKMTVNGKHEVKSVDIDSSLLEDDKELLEDLIAAAMNDAVKKVARMSEENLSKLTAGMGLPPGFKMPF